MASYPKHRAVVAWARKQIGMAELPPGSNKGPFVSFCQAATWLPGTGWAWCRAFVLRAHLQAGFTLPDRSAGAWDALDRARKRGDALNPAGYQRLIPGDEVIWAFGSGHSSIYTGHRDVAGTVWIDTIDGNVADRVQACSRPLSLVKGFIVWHEMVGAPPARKPAGQIVGGASGHRKLVVGPLRLPLPKRKPGPQPLPPPAPDSEERQETRREAARTTATSPARKPAKKPAAKQARKPAAKKTTKKTTTAGGRKGSGRTRAA